MKKILILLIALIAIALTACIEPKHSETNSTVQAEQLQNTVLILEAGYCLLNPKSVLCDSIFNRDTTGAVISKPLPNVKFTIEEVEDINLTHKKILIKIIGENSE
jgi:uncharacterized lipoprotein YajG